MRNTISGIALTLLVLLTLSACEKDNQTLLTDGIWTFKNMTTDSEDETISGLIVFAKALLTDATLEFQEGGTYIIDSPLANEPSTGDWQLVGEDQLIMDPDDEIASTSNIETLSKTELTYMETFVDAQMNSYTVTTSWTR